MGANADKNQPLTLQSHTASAVVEPYGHPLEIALAEHQQRHDAEAFVLGALDLLGGLCQTNANQVEFVIPGFRWTAQNTCDFQQPLGD